MVACLPGEPEFPLALPLAGQRRERRDAAANRKRVLAAARRLLAEHGADALTMDGVAAAAGVGKGTIFRRFGDRDGLIGALLDDQLRTFQDALLFGPPPLGPGAPALERLEAFVVELIRVQTEQVQLHLAAETARLPGGSFNVYGAMRAHLRVLLHELRPDDDADALAALLLGAMSPSVLTGLRRDRNLGVPELQTAVLRLVRGLAA